MAEHGRALRQPRRFRSVPAYFEDTLPSDDEEEEAQPVRGPVSQGLRKRARFVQK